MAAGKEFPLALVIKAVDKATAPLRQINAKIQRITSPLAKAGNSFKAFGTELGLPKLGSALTAVGSAAAGVGRALTDAVKRVAAFGAASGVALLAAVRSAEAAGSELEDMSARVGLSVDAYAELRFAAKRAGVEQAIFNSSMDAFNKRLGELRAGTGGLFTLLKKVSPTLLQQVKTAKSNEDAFALMTRAVHRLEDPAKRAALAAAAFSRSGLPMVNLMREGVGETEKLREEFRRLAGSQAAFARNAGAMGDAFDNLETAFGGLVSAAFAELFPILTDLVSQLKDFLVANRGSIAQWARETAKAISDWVKSGGIQRIIAGFKRLFAIVDPIVQKIGGWPVAIGAIAAAIVGGPVIAALGSLVVAFASLAAVIGVTPIGWFLLGVAAIAGAAYLLISNWSDVKKFFADLFGGMTQYADGFREFVVGIFTADLAKAWQGVKDMFSGGLKFLATVVDGAVALMRTSLAPVEFALRTFGVDTSFETPSARKLLLGADSAAPPSPVNRSEARVSVDFSNLPKGARASVDPSSSQPVDLSVGYSMVTP